MNKSLKTIQKIAKILKVIFLVVFIFCIIGAVFCLLGLFMMTAIKNSQSALDILAKRNLTIGDCYGALSAGMVACIGEGFLAFMSKRYLIHELKDGTPFSASGAREIRILGIIFIATPIICSAVTSSVISAINRFNTINADFELSYGSTIGIGIVLLLASLIFSYGESLTHKDDTVSSN